MFFYYIDPNFLTLKEPKHLNLTLREYAYLTRFGTKREKRPWRSVTLRDLVPFVQFNKCEKHPWSSFTFSKVAG